MNRPFLPGYPDSNLPAAVRGKFRKLIFQDLTSSVALLPASRRVNRGWGEVAATIRPG